MKIAIFRKDDDIAVIKDYRDIDDKGEVSHIMMELEFIKEELMELWEEICEREKDEGKNA